ncbi:hypothetical protein LGM90_20200 [Burkholderia sp. AU28942]|uniref:hypothetical protein n=1 Tax=Burkholderia TaxID=32008 RepID=UPI0012E9A23D|nr:MULTISPECIES: hypothetical protein [Burkholderia]MCA8310835.1 hypothetical protein [Burkholderia sp. AU28942]QTO51508.1 hypothetical protein J8I86_19005 [Burkholderia latens]
MRRDDDARACSSVFRCDSCARKRWRGVSDARQDHAGAVGGERRRVAVARCIDDVGTRAMRGTVAWTSCGKRADLAWRMRFSRDHRIVTILIATGIATARCRFKQVNTCWRGCGAAGESIAAHATTHEPANDRRRPRRAPHSSNPAIAIPGPDYVARLPGILYRDVT